MAELVAGAFLSSSFQVIFEKLASVDIRDYFGGNKLDDLVEELRIKLNSINHVLEEAEIKQYQNPRVKTWLDKLKHVAYEADQILDEIDTDAMVNKMKAESEPVTTSVLGFFSGLTTNPFEYRINKLLEKLDSLATETKRLGLEDGPNASKEGLVSWKPTKTLSTTSLVDESTIYVRDVRKQELINILLEGIDSGNQVPIISIVGLGGMGKTTLAKLVYNDKKIKEHFELEGWVYVSESFDDVGLTKAILESFKFAANGENLSLLQQQLQHELTGKKYLLVLDDIWNWNRNAACWENLLLPFNNGSSGSKIIVTTRDKGVQNVLNSKLFDLQKLDKSDCWRLFETHAFHGRNVCEHPDLELIGKEMVNKCGGLPLAVKTLGQLLQRKFSVREWTKILETDMWRLPNEFNINPVLKLSYHNLPSNHKRCFAYCSIIPKGYWFEEDELINCWMAEGLLKCCKAYNSEEEFGSEIFSDLESISFFQKSLHYYFVMHDLVNDLAKSVSGEFCKKIDGAWVEGNLERTRHIWCSLELNRVDKLQEPICEVKGLRSLILEGDNTMLISNIVQHNLFSRLKCLRMLTFVDCGLSELVDEIGNLKLLRYLDLSHIKITSLPDTICALYNLQTLLLQRCELTELPSNFSKLINLRHLKLPDLKKMPMNIGKLTNLQTLNYFIVEEHNGSGIKELANINNLHGTIKITGLGNVIDHVDAAKANLKDKKYLEELHMDFNKIESEEMNASIVERNVSVLEALQPNNNLKRLTIVNYNGNSFPNWLRGCDLPNLVSLRLKNCPKLVASREGWGLFRLNSLKEFTISDHEFENVESFPEENLLPPTLELLEVRNCSKLRIMNYKGFLHLNSLDWLYIVNCPSLESLPEEGLQLSSLCRLWINDCPLIWEKYKKEGGERWHTIRHIPHVKIDGMSLPDEGVPSSLSLLNIDDHSTLIWENYQKEGGERWYTIRHIPCVWID